MRSRQQDIFHSCLKMISHFCGIIYLLFFGGDGGVSPGRYFRLLSGTDCVDVDECTGNTAHNRAHPVHPVVVEGAHHHCAAQRARRIHTRTRSRYLIIKKSLRRRKIITKTKWNQLLNFCNFLKLENNYRNKELISKQILKLKIRNKSYIRMTESKFLIQFSILNIYYVNIYSETVVIISK